jgi:hypothetical protein
MGRGHCSYSDAIVQMASGRPSGHKVCRRLAEMLAFLFVPPRFVDYRRADGLALFLQASTRPQMSAPSI